MKKLMILLCSFAAGVAMADEEGLSVVGYLSLAGIDGESRDPNHERWIEILHIKASWDSEDPDAIDEFDSDEREPVVPQQFTFKHIDDATTTRLAIAEKNGTVIEWGYLNVCKPTGGQPVVTSTMIFRGIKIVKVKVTQEEISEGVVEFVDTVKIYADKFTWSVDGAVTRTVTIGDHPHLTAAYTSGRGTVTNAIDGASFSVPAGTKHVKVIFTAEPGWEIIGDAVVEIDTVVKDIIFGEESGYKVPQVMPEGSVTYLDYDADTGTFTNAARVCTLVTSETRLLDDGWYAVNGDVAIPKGERLDVYGTVHLILCDGAKLSIEEPGIVDSGEGHAAVAISSASLAIYGQTLGSGMLVAKGGAGEFQGYGGAGIGGDGTCPGGELTINGGTVTAVGGEHAAGIGGGDHGHGGRVTINGGTVTAKGGDHAADIGGGAEKREATVTISGGAINANSMDGVKISGGIFARPVQDVWLTADCAVIANQDEATAAEYPWAVVPYPAAWPEADAAVKAKFGDWRKGVGAGADLSTDDAQKAFLLNVAVTGIKELKIESIEVDAEGYATIVVSAPGAFFFDRINLGEINGILSIMAGKTLETMTPKAVAYWTTTGGKAMIKVKENFIRAVLGFKTPGVAADTLQLEQGEAK